MYLHNIHFSFIIILFMYLVNIHFEIKKLNHDKILTMVILMRINCNNYSPKDIIRFIRENSGKTQTIFAKDLGKTRGWTAKAERGEIKISFDDFFKILDINHIDMILSSEKTTKNIYKKH